MITESTGPGGTAPESMAEGRDHVLNYLRRELIGPVGGLKEQLEEEPPHSRYTLGVLFAQNTDPDNELDAEEDDGSGGGLEIIAAEDPVSLANQYMPSSMGLSFYFSGEPEITVHVYGARYKRTLGGRIKWTRQSLAEKQSPDISSIKMTTARTRTPVLGGAAEIAVHWRDLGSGYLVTVTLVNAIRTNAETVRGEDCLCQAGIRCVIPSGVIQEYPSVGRITSDPEELELQFLYRRKKTFAIGHGCSAEWETADDEPVSVQTEVLPHAYVPSVSHDLPESPGILSVARLADEAVSDTQLITELRAFTGLYKKWIGDADEENTDVPGRLLPAKKLIREKLEASLSRMDKGIDFLEDKKNHAMKAFRLANMAMLMQMRHGKNDLAGKRKERNQQHTEKIDYLSLDYKWRPFQLAFQLLTAESVGNEQSSSREIVDLIWFPTGGGKTEAYLAVAAFEIFLRRFRYGEAGAGTAVITRYTLRLLTSQQFQRSSRLITSCEYLRRQDPARLGTAPITIGFWAGGSASPNKFTEAVTAFKAIAESTYPAEDNKFQIDLCPWCGTGLLPLSRSEDNGDFGFRCQPSSFSIYCPSDHCEFHNRLPVSVVDDDLYRNPPSFLIGTVDKFARMAWIDGPGAFFGQGKLMPPSLVIQDELHLLSGPIGTTVGLYESAFEGLMALKGAKPKIIASTATIRSAPDQICGLFGRPTTLFPSPGFHSDDSFFARTDRSQKGRLYAGVLSSNHRATTSTVRTAAALLQAVKEADELTWEEKDAYWTLVLYHLSLRELGKTVSFARDDIPARIRIIAEAEERGRNIFDEDVLELTSNLTASAIPASLSRMYTSFDDNNCVSILACTNMLSVGVDVPRLGLMMVVGQPKTTSEYIQASSRVGRGDIPGLVIAHYSASKPRDRSHYESFQAYHGAIYRYVEPASVTPFSLPSRNRALHAALVILVRHGAGLSGDDGAGRFDRNSPKVVSAVETLIAQAEIKDSGEAMQTRLHLERLLDEWQEQVRDAKRSGYPLCYDGKGSKNIKSLLIHFGDSGSGWPTLNSMRNVDAECEISLD